MFRCSGIDGCGVVIGVGGVQMYWGCWLWCCDWCSRRSDVTVSQVVMLDYSSWVSVIFSHCRKSKHLKTDSQTTFRSKEGETLKSGHNKYARGYLIQGYS